MQFVNENGKSNWEKFVEVNRCDGYSYGVVKFALNWANLMEKEITLGNALEDIAERTSHTADTEGITGFMYGCAVDVLSKVWIYGERLKIWHNARYGVAASNGVVNPAVITISKEER